MPAEVARLDVVLGGVLDPSFTGAFNKAEASVVNFNKLSAAASQLKPFSNATSGALAAAKSVQQLNDVLAQLKIEQASATGTTELKAYNNAIKTVTSELKVLSTTGVESGSNIGKSLSGAFTNLRQIAYILPGIGIAGLFNVAFEAISAAVSEMGLFNSALDKSEALAADFNKEMSKSVANAETEITTLNALVAVAKDHSQSIATRNNAIDEANKLYPGYLNNINAENIDSQQAANAINLLSAALIRKAQVQALSNLLTQAEEKLLTKQNETVLQAANTIDAIILKLGKGHGILGLQAVGDVAKDRAKAIQELQLVVDNLSASLSKLITEQAQANDFKLLDPQKVKTVKEATDKVKELDQAIKQVALDAPDFRRVFDQAFSGIKPEALDPSKIPPLKVPVVFTTNTDTLTPILNQFKFLVDIAQTLGDAFGQVFTTLISGGKNAFKAVEQAITSLIAKMISAVVEAALLAVILSALGFTPAETGGFGGILNKLLGISKATGHAEGGIFTQPTRFGNHLFGEKGPEALIPLDRLQNMMQGTGNGNATVEFRIQGTTLVGVLNRANLRNLRNYGFNFNG